MKKNITQRTTSKWFKVGKTVRKGGLVAKRIAR